MSERIPFIEPSVLQLRLKHLFTYDPLSGLFTRNVSIRSSNAKAGMVAGGLTYEGYVVIRVDGIKYKAHRLVWLYMTGEWPTLMVDHRDTNKSNNAWANLRLADNSLNKMNAGAQANNALGLKNIHVLKNGKFRVSVGKNKTYLQKTLHTLEMAQLCANQFREQLHGDFARHGEHNEQS